MALDFTPVKNFLGQQTLGHFIDEKPVELKSVSESATIAEGLKLLAGRNILSCPVVDAEGEYTGCLSVGDVLKGLSKELDEVLGVHWTDDVATLTADKLKEIITYYLTEKSVRAVLHDGDLWMRGDPSTTLLDVVKEGFRIQDPRAHHRIFVCDPAKAHAVSTQDKRTVVNIKPGSERLDASGWVPTDVVSQLDVVNLLWMHKEILGPLGEASLNDLGAFMGSVLTIPTTATALEAFHHMAADHKSCLGIVDTEGKILANISVSDIRFLTADNIGLLLLPVVEFVTVIHGKGPSQEDALKGVRAQGAAEGEWATVVKDLPLVSLPPTGTFLQLLETFATKKFHRVYVVDDTSRAVSIITLTDVLRLVSK